MGLMLFGLGFAMGYIPIVMREAELATDPFKVVPPRSARVLSASRAEARIKASSIV